MWILLTGQQLNHISPIYLRSHLFRSTSLTHFSSLILLNRFKIMPPRLISVYHLLNYVARIVKIFF